MVKSVVRKYEVLQGKNRFYCFGLCMSSKQIGVFILALFLITGTTILFFVFDCPYLTNRLTIAIPIVAGVIFLFMICVLFRTACSDPGILPRTERDELSYYEKQYNINSTASAINQMPRFKEITIKGKVIKLKYCYTCKLYRPPRTSHCSICDNCVERFDHHCPWVGNCIGKRNYRYFYLFLSSLSVLCMYIMGFNIAHLILRSQKSALIDTIKETPATIVEIVICFFSMWSIVCLCGYHTYLISFELSTNEDIKDSFSTKRGDSSSINPYDSGSIIKNFCRIVWGPMSPSLINPRGVIDNKSSTLNGNGVADKRDYYSIHA